MPNHSRRLRKSNVAYGHNRLDGVNVTKRPNVTPENRPKTGGLSAKKDNQKSPNKPQQTRARVKEKNSRGGAQDWGAKK